MKIIQYRKLLVSFYCLLLLSGCNNNQKSANKFDREEYLFRYLKEVINVNTDKKMNLIFIISNKACNCSGNLNTILKESFTKDNHKKIFIIAKEDSTLHNTIKNNISNYQLFIDKDEKLSSYGLNNATHYLFEIKNNKIVYWNEISNATKEELSKKYSN
jgi:hypothetical protein